MIYEGMVLQLWLIRTQNTSTFNLGIELMYEYNHTVTDTVTKGWSKGESVTNTNSKTNSVSVTLPPYTAILLNQKRSSGETTYRYNCPVALNFKARIYYVSEDVRGSTYSCVHFRKIAEFGGEETGMVDLYDRYEKYKIASTADEDFIRWNDMSEHCADAINAASTTATFDSTDATFTNLTEVVKTEVDSILPILPIKYIRPVNVNDDSTLTNQQWDFDIDMNEGDSDFISRIKLKAINDVGVEFATFNQAKGHFIVVDENGNEDTSGSIVELVKVNGQNKYVAKGEGTAYLKYIINEDEYQTADMAALSPDQYITNEDIENTGSTAVIQINVHHKHRLTRHAPKAPSCTEDGNITYWTCSEGDHPCSKYFSDKNGENEIFEDEIIVKKTGHSWGEWEVTVEPTETTEGEETRECLNGCGEKLTKTLPVLTHTHKLTRHVPKAPTCTEDGNITYWTCTEGEHPCGKYFSDKNGEDEISEDETVNPATGHSWGEWEVTVQSTETTEGEATRECLNGCGETKTKVVPVLAHTHKLTRHAPKAPTCTEDGNIAYWTCSEGDNPCGKYFSDKNGEDEIFLDEMVNPATGHDWGEWKVVKEPTETVAGEKQRVCRNDPSHIEKEVIPAKGFAPGSDPNQKGVDGTAAGPGASVESADRAITGMTDDQDPKGSVYNRLQFRSNKQTTNAIILKWTKPANATQFVLYGNMCGSQNRMMKIATYIGNSKKLTEVAGKKTKKGKYYKFILVALDQNNNVVSTSKVIHVATKGGKVTNPKAVTVKKGKKAVSKVTVKMGKTVIVKSTVTKDSGKLMTHRKVEYESDNTKIATVTSNGRIKGIEKGTCYIYAYAQNGVCKKIKVTVK